MRDERPASVPAARRRIAVLLALLAALLGAAGPAAADEAPRGAFVRGKVIVRYRAGMAPATQSSLSGTGRLVTLPGGAQELELKAGSSVPEALARLRRDPGVAYAEPDYVAHVAAFQPNDPGYPLQWNFWGPFGVNAPGAWELASRRGAPGGRGVVVAVLDTGVAYRDLGRFRRAPDDANFVPGYDFVGGDPHPLDANGHGTHVAGTIAEATNNGIATAGIAYHARIMPVRVLDSHGDGDTVTVSRGIRYAVRHGADVINMSLEFAPFVRAADVPALLAALRYARRHRVVVTAVAGNEASAKLPYPAAAPGVIAVAATTEHGCRAEYSNTGRDVDVAAPGGGPDATPAGDPWDQSHCHPDVPGRSIYQETFTLGFDTFGLPDGYFGTSMATPHVSGLAALIIASRRLGPAPSPSAVEDLIERTARDIGPPGVDVDYGHGLIDAAAALR